MLRTVLMAGISLVIGYGVLVLVIDGIFQDSFPTVVMGLFMRLGASYERANELYGAIFMENKELFVALGFIVLFMTFFYLAMSKVTHYLDEIGEEIENILSDQRHR